MWGKYTWLGVRNPSSTSCFTTLAKSVTFSVPQFSKSAVGVGGQEMMSKVPSSLKFKKYIRVVYLEASKRELKDRKHSCALAVFSQFS